MTELIKWKGKVDLKNRNIEIDLNKIKDIFALSHHDFFGFGMAQTWATLYVLNHFLQKHPKIKRIVELGTGDGALTFLWGLSMKARNGKVLTYDINRPTEMWFEVIQGMPIEFRRADVFTKDVQEEVKEFIKDEKALIFCDGGSKSKEIRIYSFFLKPEDYIMAHDWGVEILEDHLTKKEHFGTMFPPSVKSLFDILDYYMQDFFDVYQTQILSMKRKILKDGR